MDSVGEYSFSSCTFSEIRIPPLVTTIRRETFSGCRYMFFIEIPESVKSIESQALGGGGLLHNVSISPDAVIEDGLLPPQLQNILGPDSEKIKMR